MEIETWSDRQRRVLRALAEEHNLKRADVVQRSGLSYWQVAGLETGERALPASWIPLIADAYGVTPQHLIDALELANPARTPDRLRLRYRKRLVEAGLTEAEISEAEAEVSCHDLTEAALDHAAALQIDRTERRRSERQRANG